MDQTLKLKMDQSCYDAQEKKKVLDKKDYHKMVNWKLGKFLLQSNDW
jgi:hypothetical protein